MKCLKDEYDMFEKSINAYAQFSGFVSLPMSVVTHSTYDRKLHKCNTLLLLSNMLNLTSLQ